MNEKLLLNRKRENDHSQYENDGKDFGKIKSIDEVVCKNRKSKIFTKKRKKLFAIKNLNKNKILFDGKNAYKKKEIKNGELDKKKEFLESINSEINSNKIEKDKQQHSPNSTIQKEFQNFETNNQWTSFFERIYLLFKNSNIIETEFPDHYSSYIHRDFNLLKKEKGFLKLKNLLSNNVQLMKESKYFFLERENEIKKSLEKYQLNQKGNIENKINLFEVNDTNGNYLNENDIFEIIASTVIHCLMKKEEDELQKLEEEDKNIINNLVFDVSKFQLNEHSIMCLISGIKFNNNITELDLSANPFSIRSSYCLGKLINSNKNLKKLELRDCNLDNVCLSMLIEGLKYDEQSLNKEQHGLEKLSLKDNFKITDTPNEEHQICEILKIFKLKCLNLTNTQLGNKGIIKLFKTYIDLLKQNKTYLENLIIINNNFKNEECLEYIGKALELINCTLKTLILSKNLITTANENNNNIINYFQNLMGSIGKNKGLRELFLIGCGIGKNHKDIDILYDMLCENKYLTSLRLFNNEINQFSDFQRIIEVFSNYKNNIKNNSVKSLDLSHNGCDIKIDDDFLNLVDNLKLDNLDISQNKMELEKKEIFKERVNALEDIKII